MLEEKLQQFGLKSYINIWTSAAGFTTEFFKILDESKIYGFYADVLKNDMDHEGNVGIISVENNIEAEKIIHSLQVFKTPCTVFETKVLEAKLQKTVEGREIKIPFTDAQKGKLSIVFPASAMVALSNKDIDYYIHTYTDPNHPTLLRDEDLKYIPPSASLMDLVLADAYVNEFRAYYKIEIIEKEKEAEKEGPEEEEDLEIEIGDVGEGNSEVVEEEPKKEEKKEEAAGAVSSGASPEKKKNKKKIIGKTGAVKNVSVTALEHSFTAENIRETGFSNNVDLSSHASYEENYRESAAPTNSTTSTDSAASSESTEKRDEYRKESSLDVRNNTEYKSQSENTSYTRNQERSSSLDTQSRETGFRDFNSDYKRQEPSSSYESVRKEEELRHKTKPTESIRTGGMTTAGNLYHDSFRKKETMETGRNPDLNNKDPRFEPIRDRNSERASMIAEYNRGASSNDPVTSQGETSARGTFTYKENPKAYHLEDTAKSEISKKSGRALDGSEQTGFGGYTDPSTLKQPNGKREILFNNHAELQKEKLKDKAEAAKEASKSKAKTLTKPVKEALEEAIFGDSEGGTEGKKYLKNSAPAAVYIAKGYRYGAMLSKAESTMHDEGIWEKALAATRGEANTDAAKSIIKKELEKAGLSEEALKGKNIVKAQEAIDKANTARSTISYMSEKKLSSWMDSEGRDLPEGLKNAIGDYREKVKKDPTSYLKENKHFTDKILSTKLSLEAFRGEVERFEKEASTLLKNSATMYELILQLKERNYSEEFIKKLQTINFQDLKNKDAIGAVKGLFGYDEISKKIAATNVLNSLAYEGHIRSAGVLIMNMTDMQFLSFLDSLNVSSEAKNEILKLGIAKIKANPELLNGLIKKLGGTDAATLRQIQDFIRGQVAKPDSSSGLGVSVAKSLLRTGFGQSEGANALWENLSYYGNAKRITTAGIKISLTISNKFLRQDAALTRGLRVASHPVKYAAKKVTSTAAGKAVANTRFAQGVKSGFRTTRSLVHAPGRFVGKTTRWAARGLRSSVVNGARNVVTAVKGAAQLVGSAFSGGAAAAGGTSGGAAAVGGTVAGGWIVAIVVIVILLIVLIIGSEDDKPDSVGNYQYTQFDEEFQTEILNELQNLNDTFEEEVNRAATDRTYWSAGTGFSETDSVTHFESGAYSVYFRDDEGNELDHLDINNSKAILDMAAQYCKYTNWSKPSETASDEIKLAYEQIKQYYLDYCKFLWVSTHRITLEEYRPGDEKYSEDDRSGLTTDSQGICPKNGTRVWLTKDFTRESMRWDGEEHVCGVDNGYASNPEGVCDPVPGDPAYSDYGENAICSHPEEDRRDGWSVVSDEATGQPVTRTHYICSMRKGHTCWDCSTMVNDGNGSTHYEYEYHHCGEICPHDGKVFCPASSHKHIDYLWEYHCGGHMGAVIYVTVGDVSRLASMQPAKDIDLNDLSNYPDTSNDVYDYADTEGE